MQTDERPLLGQYPPPMEVIWPPRSCRSPACSCSPHTSVRFRARIFPFLSHQGRVHRVDKPSAVHKNSARILDLCSFVCVDVQIPRIGARIFGVTGCRHERLTMPKFVAIGYGDCKGYDNTEACIRDAAHAHDARLLEAGAVMGVAGTPVQVRNPDATKIETQNAPFMTSSLPVAGFTVIEAKDLEEAVTMVSKTPCAVAHGVVEVWPLEEAR